MVPRRYAHSRLLLTQPAGDVVRDAAGVIRSSQAAARHQIPADLSAPAPRRPSSPALQGGSAGVVPVVVERRAGQAALSARSG
jgi:hypothetical protein